jgi:Mn-dependent DtxR family transcriptional regulator
MEDSGIPEISRRKVEYLKFLREHGDTARIGELAAAFSVDPSTVSKAVQDLAATDLVAHLPYGGVSLTPAGQEFAEYLLRRHRILGLILTHYGLDRDEACREAQRFECYVSREAIDRMCRSLGHPTRGICGAISHDRTCQGDE